MRKFLVHLLKKTGLKEPVAFVLDIGKLSLGFGVYSISRGTPGFSYQSLVRVFCATQGRSNDFLSRILSRFKKPLTLTSDNAPAATPVLGPLLAPEPDLIGTSLKFRGYHVFGTKLGPEVCARILKFSYESECSVRANTANAMSPPIKCKYDPAQPIGTRYDFSQQSLINNKDIQALLADPSLIRVAQEYLGSAPVLDIVNMWWNTAFSAEPNKMAAQYYHFDMDRIKWLKFFFYLTDVTEDSGPHCFVSGSHRTGSIPSDLLKHGYARLDDADVERHYSKERFIEFTGSRGTIIAEDTRGLHKGKNVRSGDRLVFQIQFSNSLFGANTGEHFFEKVEDPALKAMISTYPQVYRHFLR